MGLQGIHARYSVNDLPLGCLQLVRMAKKPFCFIFPRELGVITLEFELVHGGLFWLLFGGRMLTRFPIQPCDFFVGAAYNFSWSLRIVAKIIFSQEMAAKYVQYKGIKFPPGYNSVDSLCFAENEFQVRNDDIFNITYPKSGTVWMIEIMSLILSGGNPTWNQSVLNSLRAPWFTTQLGLETAHNLPSPRLLTCHLPIQIFPKAFFSSKAKVVYTMRDPRDVLVSYYHFSKMCIPFGDPKSFNHFLERFLSGDVPFGSWFDHITGWMKLKGKSNFFFISYEQLQQDLCGSVKHLSHFLGKELDEAAIASVVENTSFEAMRKNNMCNSTVLPKEFMDQEKGTFLRKGICGDWKTHFTVAQSEYFNRVYQEKMQGLKETFPWEQTGDQLRKRT